MTREESNADFHLVPEECHRHTMLNRKPLMAYAGGDVAAWQAALRAKLQDLIGDTPTPAPLNVRSLWKREHPLGSIEKIIFTAETLADVPAYVCLPKNAKPPYVFFICLQGHSSGMHLSIAIDRETEKKTVKVEGDRDFGLGCMARGVAALCVEQRALGERRQRLPVNDPRTPCHDATLHALMLGRTLIGERVFDVDRAIDYLETRGDVDMSRLGVMGNSGGGTVSLFAAALLPRVRFAMPSCYFCTFRDSLMSVYHCMCNYIPGLLKYAEMADVMGLFAPKPLVIVAGRQDPIFPFNGVQEAFEHLRTIYKAAGAENLCRLVVGEGEHRFYAREGWGEMLKLLGNAGK